jgi:hypothetical protein
MKSTHPRLPSPPPRMGSTYPGYIQRKMLTSSSTKEGGGLQDWGGERSSHLKLEERPQRSRKGGEKGTRVEAGEPPPFSSLSLSLYAGRANAATGRRPARWFNRGREAMRNEQTETTKPWKCEHRDLKIKCVSPPLIQTDGWIAGQGRARHVAARNHRPK